MKIVFPLEYCFPSQIGGPSNTLYWHCKYLSSKGYDVEIVTSSVGLPKDNGIKLNSHIQNKNFGIRYCTGGRLSVLLFLYTLREIMRCDILHCSSLFYPYNLFFVLFAIFLGKKVVISPRGELFANAILSHKVILKKIYIKIFSIFQSHIIFHATSDEEKTCIDKCFNMASVVILPNFIITNYREKKDYSKNLIFLGRISEIKRIDKLILALCLSDGFKRNDAKLYIVGRAVREKDLKYKKKIVDLIHENNMEKNVLFLGEKTGDEKGQLLNNAFALVLPSESENFGNVVLEAMSNSTPAITSKGTPWKILEDYKVGWWTDNTPLEFAKAIDMLYQLSENEYKKICLDCLDFVKDNYDIFLSPRNKWIEIYSNL